MVKVSVILPNYNHALFLQQRIESIVSQSFTDFELIILDDASTDNSREIIETYTTNPFVSHIIYNESNSGSPFGQWKKGVELAKGDWIWIAESDDIADINFLEKMMAQVKVNPAVSFAYCDAYIKNEPPAESFLNTFSAIKNEKTTTIKWKYGYLNNGAKELNESLKWSCTVNNVSSVLFNKNRLIESINLIHPYRYHGDWLLYIILAQKGDIAYTAEVLNTYRNHENNHSKSDAHAFNLKTECFSILNFMLKQKDITQKKELITYFIHNYIGFGLAHERKIFSEYWKINKRLALRIFFRLLVNKGKQTKKA